jgi:hypothetical protein
VVVSGNEDDSKLEQMGRELSVSEIGLDVNLQGRKLNLRKANSHKQ